MSNEIKYARRCDITNKGMNNGWVWGDGVFYTSTKELTLEECRKDREHILEVIKNIGCEISELDNVQNDKDFKTLESAIQRLDNNEDSNEDLLTIGYYTDYLYYTDWDVIEDDWYYLEDGTEIQTD